MNKKQFIDYIETQVGILKITTDSNSLLAINFVESKNTSSKNKPDILLKSLQQLKEYFNGIRKVFDLEIKPAGTDFQQKTWKEVNKIPFGETSTYLTIAKRTGSDKNTRAVGTANGKNPIPIIIPCHRIIGTNRKLTGYAGGIERKRWLLQHELNHTKKADSLF